MAFHVDRDVLLAGFDRLVELESSVLARGDSTKRKHATFEIATEALVQGFDWPGEDDDESELRELVLTVRDHHMRVGPLVQRMMFGLLGVDFDEG